MRAKAALFQFTNQFGERKTAFATWYAVYPIWDRNGSDSFVKFNLYASPEAAQQGREPYDRVNMPITFADVVRMTNREAHILEGISDGSWALAQEKAFIPDYSETDANGQPVLTLKSLTDLGARMIDLDIDLDAIAADLKEEQTEKKK